jgi:hypothetical protein
MRAIVTSAVNRILSLAVLLPVVLFSIAGTSFASWRCRSDGIERLSCCCPKQMGNDEQPARDASPGPAVSPLGCCEVQQHIVEKAPSDVARAGSTLLPAAAVALPVGLLAVPPAPTWAVLLRAPEPEPPPTGRVLLLRKQSFLI